MEMEAEGGDWVGAELRETFRVQPRGPWLSPRMNRELCG